MLYETYQFQDDLLTPFRHAARLADSAYRSVTWCLEDLASNSVTAALELIFRYGLTHTRPEFGIASVRVGKRRVRVKEEIALALPFGNLVHFAKAAGVPQPRILVAAPLSGHFATLLRGTVKTLLSDHDVYLTDWFNARDVPLEAGNFGVDDYITYLMRYLEAIGPGAHLLAVCQPCVQALAAVAIMSEDDHPATPRSMTLMAGPVDTRESPTEVNKLAMSKSLAWFERSVIARVPYRYRGGGRMVYPGFVQLLAFMAMNPERHHDAHHRLYRHLAAGEIEDAERIKAFYDDYFAVLDLTEEFYLETIDRIFQRAELADGSFIYCGRPVDPGQIRKTALLTVEGGRDDICALGQTAAAHDLCRSLRPHLKRHHLQANVGHYGVFNGKRWEHEIYPVVRNLVLAMQ